MLESHQWAEPRDKATQISTLPKTCSSLGRCGSQSVSRTINALISGTRRHWVSIHYAWVASAGSPTWTFTADWRSCVDSRVLFKAHLYVRLRRCYMPSPEGLKWAPLSLLGAPGGWLKCDIRHSVSLAEPPVGRWHGGTSASLSDASKVWTCGRQSWRAPQILRRQRRISDTQVMLMKLFPHLPKSLWNRGQKESFGCCAWEMISRRDEVRRASYLNVKLENKCNFSSFP